MARTPTAKKETAAEATEVVETAKKPQTTKQAAVEKEQTPVIPKSLDNSTEVVVKSNFNGKLYFRNDRTGNVVEWNRLGEKQNLYVEDIKHIRSTQSGFFEDGWITLLGVEGEYNYLTQEQLYSILSLNKYCPKVDYNNMFASYIKMTRKQITPVIEGMTETEKKMFGNYIASLTKDEIENISTGTIKAINEKLNIDLEDYV